MPNIGLELVKGHAELEKFMGDILQGRTEDELKRQAGILGKTVLNNGKAAHAIVNGSFKNGTFSDRIWQYHDLMREDLGRTLAAGLIQGKNPRAIGKDLKKYWYGADPLTGGGAKYCMERLMRTELARVQTEAQKLSFERNGFNHYEFITNSGCCSDCRTKNGKHFPVEKMMPGENAPPMHPNCRCSVAAWEDSSDYEAWLDYLDKGGTTADWNAFAKAEAGFATKYKENERISKSKDFAVDTKILDSRMYADKFADIAADAETRRDFLANAKAILKHRSGQNGEDLYLYNTATKRWYKSTTGETAGTPEYTQDIFDGIRQAKNGDLVAFHNHPASMPPSPEDINAALKNGYKKGYALCHDGKIFEYSAPDEYINPSIYNLRVAKLEKSGYTMYDAQLETMKELAKLYDFEFREVI